MVIFDLRNQAKPWMVLKEIRVREKNVSLSPWDSNSRSLAWKAHALPMSPRNRLIKLGLKLLVFFLFRASFFRTICGSAWLFKSKSMLVSIMRRYNSIIYVTKKVIRWGRDHPRVHECLLLSRTSGANMRVMTIL